MLSVDREIMVLKAKKIAANPYDVFKDKEGTCDKQQTY